MATYHQRAKFVRLLLSSTKPHNKKYHDITHLKFVTRDPDTYQGQGYNWVDEPHNSDKSLEGFYKFVKSRFEDFEHADIPTDNWERLSSCFQLQNFCYKKINKMERWTTDTSLTKKVLDEKLSKMSDEENTLFSLFGTALKCDMKNGSAKLWLNFLVNVLCNMTENFSLGNALGFSPSLHDPTNTVVESIQGDLENPITCLYYNEPYVVSSKASLNMSSLSITSGDAEGLTEKSVKSQTVVPDYCMVLKEYPGIFPFVVELKPAYFEDDGHWQNVKQMLSKLFFQDVIFGIVISPRSFQLSVITKKQDNVEFAYTERIKLFRNEDNTLKLNLETLKDLHTFMFSVLQFARK